MTLRWELTGSPTQEGLVLAALERCRFPWDVIPDRTVPVVWEDLSTWGAASAAEVTEVHHHGGDADTLEREIDGRRRVLGLAWYSGKVSLDLSLEATPELAQEVFLSEGAHMVDFFYMTDPMRVAVWNAAHPDRPPLPADADITDAVDLDPADAGHDHGWFDVGGYYSWVGEWFMGAFVRAFSDIPVTIEFDHPLSDTAAAAVRVALIGDEPTPEPPPPAEPPLEPSAEPPAGCLSPKAIAGAVRHVLRARR